MQQRRSVYNAGAADGLIMGIYLSFIFLLQSYGIHNMALLIVGDIMMLAIPVLAYILLKRGYDLSHQFKTFSAVWLHGIIFFLCGSVILALVVYIFMRFIQPDFIYQQIKLLEETYRGIGSPDALQLADVFQKIIDKHMLPTPISVAFSLIWFVGFFGAILSCLLAVIVKLRRRKNTYTDNNKIIK